MIVTLALMTELTTALLAAYDEHMRGLGARGEDETHDSDGPLLRKYGGFRGFVTSPAPTSACAAPNSTNSSPASASSSPPGASPSSGRPAATTSPPTSRTGSPPPASSARTPRPS